MKKPVNSKLIQGGVELLNFLYATKGNKILSGQHDFISSGTILCDSIEELTGKVPAVWGTDISFIYTGRYPENIQHCGPVNLEFPRKDIELNEFFQAKKTVTITDVKADEMRNKLVDRIILQHKKGHIITLMWHSPRPEKGDYCDDGDLWTFSENISDEYWNNLVTPGTKLHEHWEKQVDKIVPYLKQLNEAGVPILWRPYHEMNGVWFWWGNRKGDNGYRQLWIQLYERLTDFHQINNLVWVWNPNSPRDKKGDEAYPYIDFYPGNSYVDVLAVDVYWNDFAQSHHDELLQLADGRPIALGEVGHLPSKEILKKQSQWSWIMSWGNLVYYFNNESDIIDFYNNPDIITL